MKRIFTFLGIFLIGMLSVAFAQPAITNITSPTSDVGIKVTGNTIAITVEFDIPITSAVTPVLALNTGVNATYDSFSGNNLYFTYNVADGQETSDLDCNSLTGTINGSAWAESFPTGIDAKSLASNKNFVVDSRIRSIISVTTPEVDGKTFKTPGEAMLITVEYNYPVYVSGRPILMLNTENSGVYASYSSGSGSEFLIFRYIIGSGDQTVYGDSLDYKATTSLNPNGGSITFPIGTDVDVTLPVLDGGGSLTGTLGTAKQIIVDTQRPTVLSISETSGATSPLKIGDVATLTVRFSEPVIILAASDAQKPRLLLETGDVDTLLAGSAGALAPTHQFSYTVTEGEKSNKLNYKSTNSLSIGGGGSIKDAAGNAAVLTLPSTYSDSSLGFSNLKVDGVKPTIANITSTTRDGSYNAGDINLTLTFSEPIETSSLTLDLDLNTGATVRRTFTTDTTATSLSFTYPINTATDTEKDTLDVLSISFFAGSLTDTSGNTLNFTLPIGPDTIGSLSKNKSIAFDKTAPIVTKIISADSIYGIGDMVFFGVKFNEIVKVSGSPKIPLNSNDTTAFAVYNSGTNSDSLVFKYKVLDGHKSSKLDLLDPTTTVIDLSNSALTDLAGNTGTYTFPNPTGLLDSTIIIDGVKPFINAITGSFAKAEDDANSNGIANAGDTVTISVQFDTTITITNTPKLLLETGRTDRYAIFSKMTDSKTAAFKYAVQMGDTTSLLEVKSTTSLIGGVIKDGLGNEANRTLTLGLLPASSIEVDALIPQVINVTSTKKNGSYRYIAGDATNNEILIFVQFDDEINVGGTPVLTLTNGISNGSVAYNAANSTANSIAFLYTIGNADNIQYLDYKDTLDIAPGAAVKTKYALADLGIITDNGGNIVTDTNGTGTIKLPAIGATGSLGRNKSIVIDNSVPTIDSIGCTMKHGNYNIGDNIYFTVVFTDKVYVGGKPKIEMNLTGTPTDPYAYYYSGSGSNKLRFRYTVKENDESADLNYAVAAVITVTANDSICDKAGNKFGYALPAQNSNGMLYTVSDNLYVDGVKPYVSAITPAISNNYGVATVGNATDSITISVTYSEPVILSSTPRLVLETGRVDRYCRYLGSTIYPVTTSTLEFSYIVKTGDEVAKLNFKNPRALMANIKDTVGNSGIKTVDTALFTTVIPIDGIAPKVKRVTSISPNGYYGAGDTVNIRVEFTEEVVPASSALTFELGAASGLTNHTLTNDVVYSLNNKLVNFRLDVVANDQNKDLSYLDINALTGTLTDANGNQANLTLPALTSSYSLGRAKNIYVDALAPGVPTVSSPNADGTYGAGYTLFIKLTYAEKVKVAGKPKLKLNVIDSDNPTDSVFAYYYSGSGSNTLQFKYEIKNTHTSSGDLKLTSDVGFASTGSIKDYAGNTASYVVINTTLTNIDVDGSQKSAEIEFNELTTNVIDAQGNAELSLEVYPNPIKENQIVIYFGGQSNTQSAEIQIYNVLGNLVSTEKVKISEKVVLKQNLQSGIYIMSVLKGNEVLTQRIMVE